MTHELSEQARLLNEKIESKNAVVGIIGLGYVGLPLADAIHTGGLNVIGFDIDAAKIADIESGINYLKHLGNEMTQRLNRSDRFEVTSDFSKLSEPDVIIVCVPTPVGSHLEPDLKYVIKTAQDIGSCLRKGQLIVLESTTYPGTTAGEFLPAILKSAIDQQQESFTPGIDMFVAFSPEREDPGRKSHSTTSIPKLVGGIDQVSTDLACKLYAHGVGEVIPVASAEIAEAAKILENVFRSVNIALVNELKGVFDTMGIDIWEVIRAASTKPFGYTPFYPGPGLGGHCIPIDPYYLAWKAREHGCVTRFIELAGEINRSMPEYVVEKTAAALNDDCKSIKGSKIMILGLAYKPNVDDTRETPAAEIIAQLAQRGAIVSYHDPHVNSFPKMRNYSFEMDSIDLNESSLLESDCVIIVTDHQAIDWTIVGKFAGLIVDTRNAMNGISEIRARVVKA